MASERWWARMAPALVALAAGCTAAADPAPAPAPPNVAIAFERPHPTTELLLRYLECEECTDGEREAILDEAQRGDEQLILERLAVALREGPSPARIAVERRAIALRFRALETYVLTSPVQQGPIGFGFTDLVARQVDNLKARYQIRAVEALDAIDTPAARAVMSNALATQPMRGDVLQELRLALPGGGN